MRFPGDVGPTQATDWVDPDDEDSRAINVRSCCRSIGYQLLTDGCLRPGAAVAKLSYYAARDDFLVLPAPVLIDSRDAAEACDVDDKNAQQGKSTQDVESDNPVPGCCGPNPCR